MRKYISNSPLQTKNLAKKLAKNFNGGEVLGLVGELGSGKTQFVKGLAEYFQVKQTITSPTFVLFKPYKIKNFEEKVYSKKQDKGRSHKKIKYLVHVDCYRLRNPQELLAVGLGEYLNNPNCLTVVEWAEKIKDILPVKKTVWIKFKFPSKTSRPLAENKNQRIITVSG